LQGFWYVIESPPQQYLDRHFHRSTAASREPKENASMSTQMIEIITNPYPTPTQPAVFDPQNQATNVGDTITWHNGDTEAHWPAPSASNKTGWFQFQIPAGGTSDTLAPGPNTTPSAPYVLDYVCANHPDETGQITVNPQL
jgi:plastocyanin